MAYNVKHLFPLPLPSKVVSRTILNWEPSVQRTNDKCPLVDQVIAPGSLHPLYERTVHYPLCHETWQSLQVKQVNKHPGPVDSRIGHLT